MYILQLCFRAYSPGSVVDAGAAAAGVWSHPLVATDPAGWIDASRAGAHHGLWPPPSHEQPRYVSPGGGSVKWDMSNAGMNLGGNGGYKKTKAKSEPNGPGSVTSGSEGAGGGFIPDETLQHLTVKELNKRVRNGFVFVAFLRGFFFQFSPLYFATFFFKN